MYGFMNSESCGIENVCASEGRFSSNLATTLDMGLVHGGQAWISTNAKPGLDSASTPDE